MTSLDEPTIHFSARPTEKMVGQFADFSFYSLSNSLTTASGLIDADIRQHAVQDCFSYDRLQRGRCSQRDLPMHRRQPLFSLAVFDFLSLRPGAAQPTATFECRWSFSKATRGLKPASGSALCPASRCQRSGLRLRLKVATIQQLFSAVPLRSKNARFRSSLCHRNQPERTQ